MNYVYAAKLGLSTGTSYIFCGLWKNGGTDNLLTDTDAYAFTDAWTSKASYTSSLDRTYLAAAFVTTKAYVSGGGWDSAYLQTHDSYTPSSDSWASLTALPTTTRYGHSAVGIGTAVFVFGGANGSGENVRADEYSTGGDSWSTNTDVPSPARAFHTGARAGSDVYLMGGVSSGSALVDNDEYDTSGDSYSAKTDIGATGVQKHGACTVQYGGSDDIFLIGGSEAAYKNKTIHYDVGVNSFTDFNDMIEGRNSFGATTMQNKCYIFCGNDNRGDCRRTEEFDQSSGLGVWTSKTDSPEPNRQRLAATRV